MTNFTRTETVDGDGSEVTYEGSVTVGNITINTVTVFTERNDDGEVEFCNVIAQHNGECIYGGDLDDALEKAVSTIVGFDVQLTEGGEQDDGIAVFA